jgi:hypothetical protein
VSGILLPVGCTNAVIFHVDRLSASFGALTLSVNRASGVPGRRPVQIGVAAAAERRVTENRRRPR